MPAVIKVMKVDSTLITLIKPQFEARRSQVRLKGKCGSSQLEFGLLVICTLILITQSNKSCLILLRWEVEGLFEILWFIKR
jgi:predicted rRNA methylase YqxC with S4 and FtsJ domains